MKIGVFALQGAFLEHERALQKLGAEVTEIRRRSDFLRSYDGIVLPGGESTVQGKLLRSEELLIPVREAITNGLPVLGTCAGLILLAKEIIGGEASHLSVMDICVKRNAYGRQLGSFVQNVDVATAKSFPAVFIRAPYIESANANVQILAKVDGKIVAAKQKNMLALAFHPELTEDLRLHEYFLKMTAAS